MSLYHSRPGQFNVQQHPELVLTCEIHSEPGADALNLQVQQTLDVLGFGGRRGVAGVEGQHLDEIGSLVRLDHQVFLVGVGVHPGRRGERGRGDNFSPRPPSQV